MQHLSSEARQLFSAWGRQLSHLCVWQKIEAIDEDEEADNDFVTSDLEQMQNLLEFKVIRSIKHSSSCACAETPRLNSSVLEALQHCLKFRLQSNLLFQHEEVQFLENELENQKQKYQQLVDFTKSLLSAVRNNDLERQQVHSESTIIILNTKWEALPYCSPYKLQLFA